MAIAGPAVARSATGELLAQGPQGPPGVQGPPGATGPAGTGGIPASQTSVTLANGLNDNVVVPPKTSVRFGGYSANVVLGGLSITPTPTAGVPFDVIFTVSGYKVTIKNESSTSSAANRFTTGTGGDVDLPPGQACRARVVYDGTTNRYVLQSTGVVSLHGINVKDFGATGNGVTDDTAAIQATVDYIVASAQLAGFGVDTIIGGNTVYIPAGLYLLSSEISIPNEVPITIRGEGKASSFLYWNTICNGIHQDLSALGYNAVVIEDVTLQNVKTLPYTTWWANLTSVVRQPNTTYALGAVRMAPGNSNRLLQCTTGGTTGTYVPFGTLWAGVPTNPNVNPFGNTLVPDVFITGTPVANYKQVVVEILTGGLLSGGITFRWSVTSDAQGTATWNAGGSVNSTAPVALGGTGLSANFTTGVTTNFGTVPYVAGPGAGGVYASPAFWAGFSAILGDVITDGTCVWTVIDGGCALLAENSANWRVNRVDIAGFINGVVWDNCEIMNCQNMGIAALNAIWLVGSNERQNAPTATPAFVGVTNINRFENIDITTDGIGFAWSGGGSVATLHGVNFEGAGFGAPSWQIYIPAADDLTVEDFLAEGAANGAYVGGINPFTGFLSGGPTNFKAKNANFGGSGSTSPIPIPGGSSPPAVSIAGIPAFLGNLVIKVDSSGSQPLATATIRWSTDGGTTWTATGVSIASGSVTLTGTGYGADLVATFPSGTYVGGSGSTCNIWVAPLWVASSIDGHRLFGITSAGGSIEFDHCTLECEGKYVSTCIDRDDCVGLKLTEVQYQLGKQIFDWDTNGNGSEHFGTPLTSGAMVWNQSSSQVASGIGWNCFPLARGFDIYGQFALRATYNDGVTSGTFNNLANPGTGVLELYDTGAGGSVSGNFEITGFTGGTEGQILELVYTGAHTMTIANLNSGSSVGNQIRNEAGADQAYTPPSNGFVSVRFRFSSLWNQWFAL